MQATGLFIKMKLLWEEVGIELNYTLLYKIDSN